MMNLVRLGAVVAVGASLLLLMGASQAAPAQGGPYKVFLPVVDLPPYLDEPGKGVAGYLPRGAENTLHHHSQHQWNLTCSPSGPGVACINHLKKRAVLAEQYPEEPALLVETLRACSGGEWWFGDEFNLYGEDRFPLGQWVEEAHWIRALFGQHAPPWCKFGFGAPIITPLDWGSDGIEWIERFHETYYSTFGESLEVDIYLLDDYWHGEGTYERTVEAHNLIRALYGDVEIVAREWGCLGEGCQEAALDYACKTGWHRLYDRFYWFIGKADSAGIWEHTALYLRDGTLAPIGHRFARFPSLYCGHQDPW